MTRLRVLLAGLAILLFGLLVLPSPEDETAEQAYRRLWKGREG